MQRKWARPQVSADIGECQHRLYRYMHYTSLYILYIRIFDNILVRTLYYMALTRLSLAVETASLQVDAFISAPKWALPPVAILVGKMMNALL